MRKSIIKTAEWYSHFLKKNDIREITYLQIKEYFKIKQ